MRLSLLAIALAFFITQPASAAPVRSATDIAEASLIDFNGFTYPASAPSMQLGSGDEGVTLSERRGFSVRLVNETQNLHDNGQWTSGRNGYASMFATTLLTYEFRFDGAPVSGAGFLAAYTVYQGRPLTDLVIEAVGVDGSVLETFDVVATAPIDTSGGVDAGGFRGILRDQADIAAIRVTGSQVVLDDLQFSRAVPEPGAVLPVLSALILLARRSRN